jgi:hypothetical protein
MWAVLLLLLIFTGGCGSSSSVSVTAPSTQARCALTATAGPVTMDANGGSGTVQVTVSRECSWTAKSSVDWIALSSSASGQGSAAVPYTVAPNAIVTTRRGQILVNDQHVDIQQAAAAPPPAPVAPAPQPPAPAPTPAPTPSPTPSPTPAPTPTPTPTPAPTPAPTPTPTPAPTPSPTPQPQSIAVSGKVAGLSGTCPALAFTVDGNSIHTNLLTLYVGDLECKKIKKNTNVTVDALIQVGGWALATRIDKADK